MQIGICERDQARVHAQRVRAAEALEAALFEHAQQLGLNAGSERGHFIEHDRAALREFEAAGLRRDAPVNAPFSWPNNSDSTSSGGKAGAINFQKWRIVTRSLLVNPARELIFARAAFAGDENSGSGTGDFAPQDRAACCEAALAPIHGNRSARRDRLRRAAVRVALVAAVGGVSCANFTHGCVVSELGDSGRLEIPRWAPCSARAFIRRRYIQSRSGAPEPLEIVIKPRALAEDVHDERAVIEQHPFGARPSFAMRQGERHARAVALRWRR